MDILSQGPSYLAYRREIEGQRLVPAVRAGILIILGVTAAFPFLDWIVFPEQISSLLVVRAALAMSFVPLWFLVPRAPGKSMLAMVLFEGLHLIAVIGIAGGVTSAYYPGILLLFLGLPVVLPLTAKQAAGMLLPLLGIFGSLPVLTPTPFALRSYLTSMFFVGGSVVVSIVGSYLLDQLRFREHQRRQEVTSARDKLAVLDEAKNRFTANVHHELRTPLTLIIGPLEGILSRDYGDLPEPIERPLQVMRANSKRLLLLINDLLDLAKLESKQFAICRRIVDLRSIANDVVVRASALAERNGVDVSWHAAPEVTSVSADPDAVDKVLTNLVGNALKFTPRGGRVAVEIRGANGGMQVDVSDDGIGLTSDQLTRVFDRFAQVDTEKRKHEGTGIGLSLSKELVEFHGGEIWARSDGPHKGSTFSFYIPSGTTDTTSEGDTSPTEAANDHAFVLPPEVPDSREVDSRETPLHPQDAGRVLVVDDNAEMRELIRFVLSREFSVETVQDGAEAWARLRQDDFDLVVTDIMMPRMSGTELCRRIKSEENLTSIPVVLVSSKASDDMRIEGLEIGADDYVTKPFHPRELLARSRSLVQLRRTQTDLAERNVELKSALSKLTLAQSKIVETERLVAVGELAAGIAHEVNNPVNYALNAARIMDGTIHSICDVFDGKSKGPAAGDARDGDNEFGQLTEEIRDLSGIIQDGLERTARLVLSLRDLSSPAEADDYREVDLSEAIQSTIDLIRRDLASRGVNLRFDKPVAPVVVRGDSGSLKQLVLNVLKNAAEAMDGVRGDVVVEVGESISEVRILFRDQGSGVNLEERERIFDPFFSTKGPGRGTGLGLPICRKIAAAHGGSLELKETSGRGSVFELALPKV